MIKRYKATIDNTITNAFEPNMTTRGTGSNMGRSDILEVFTIYNQVSNSAGASRENERILVQFDIASLQQDRTNGTVPSGSSYYLKMFNAPHVQTVPDDLVLEILAVSASWQEGIGLDMEDYGDLTYNVVGSNWIMSAGSTTWKDPSDAPAYTTAITGGAFHASPIFSASFSTGMGNMDVDITSLVNEWLGGSKTNYGVGIRVSSSLANSNKSYYTKKFYGRGSHLFFDRPYIEAKWDSARLDDRGNFYTSSSLVPASDNLNLLYLYNYARGRLTNIPAVESDASNAIRVKLYTSLSGTALTLCDATTYAVGGKVSTGIYSASLCVETTASQLYDVWYLGSDDFHSGSITTKSLSAYEYSDTQQKVLTISNRQTSYNANQTHRMRLYSRYKNWSPNIYNTAVAVPNTLIFESASYKVYRVIDDRVVIPYGTGSIQDTRLSYDVSGNYFDLDATLLEPNYTYGINFSIYDPDTQSYEEQPYVYKIRVVKNEY